MSLKAIHIVFIIASCLMTAFFGVWAFREYGSGHGSPIHLVYGVSSIIAFIALLVYGKYFLRKLKHINYL